MIERVGPKRRPPKFCSDAHRKAFNNRRLTRGAILYDEIMKWRFDRKGSPDALDTVSRIAAIFREKDKYKRAGRPSWLDEDAIRDVLTVAMESD